MMSEYTEAQMAEIEAHWCENCCNFTNPGVDGMAVCALTGTMAWCQEYGGNCVGFNVPAADVVEVVRCKDCKYSYFVKSFSKYECKKGCGTLKYSNDYCSYGEAKMDGVIDTNVGGKMDGKGEG